MKKKNVRIIAMVFIFWATLLASFVLLAKNCATYEPCEVNTVCECTISPSSAFDRYFYFVIENFVKSHVYHCYFSVQPNTFSIRLEGSSFPVGSTVSCAGSCFHFPIELLIDTTNMQEGKGKSIVKYFVPGSDMPNTVKAECK